MIRCLFALSNRYVQPVYPTQKEDVLSGEGIKGVWVKPVPHMVVGEIKDAAEKNGVSSIRIPGYWMEKEGLGDIKPGAPPAPGEKVVCFLHGGGYMSLSAYPHDLTAAIPRGILERCPTITRSFSIEYRLSRTVPLTPAGSFPCALIDALAGYNYLVEDVGFNPKDIILTGDSAGGNLALALVRYLTEYSVDHIPSSPLPPPPGALLLLSPWTDMGTSHNDDINTLRNTYSDYLDISPERAEYMGRAFAASLGLDVMNTYRYISPGSKDPALDGMSFKGYPKTFIVAGGAEMLLEQIVRLKNKMQKELGDEHVVYHCASDAVHDFVALSIEPERTETLAEISKWLSTA